VDELSSRSGCRRSALIGCGALLGVVTVTSGLAFLGWRSAKALYHAGSRSYRELAAVQAAVQAESGAEVVTVSRTGVWPPFASPRSRAYAPRTMSRTVQHHPYLPSPRDDAAR